jgi:D-sedoheptulose 7-phosphate isomerase
LVRTGKGQLFENAALGQGYPVFDNLKAVTTVLTRAAGESNLRVLLQDIFEEHIIAVSQAATQVLPYLAECIHIARQCLKAGNKILVCGNGGSAADAQHFVAELVGRYSKTRQALSAVALGTDAATMSALSNDFGFDQMLSRQVEALGRRGDVLIALSTSGNSVNVINAAIAARARDCTVVAFTGRTGGNLAQYAHVCLRVPADSVARIQELHELCMHSLAQALDLAALASDTP